MNTTATQADARRRIRRRTLHGLDPQLFCGTNGCASRLDLDERTGIATCHICGFTRRIHPPTH
ncbi:MAG: hypothetical protein ACP5VP_07490 [Candidatus Limnocylindrales bacterium]